MAPRSLKESGRVDEDMLVFARQDVQPKRDGRTENKMLSLDDV